MELNNDNQDSEWLTQLKQFSEKKRNETPDRLSQIVYPISKDCCKNPEIIVSNDGNKAQICMNCGRHLCYD